MDSETTIETYGIDIVADAEAETITVGPDFNGDTVTIGVDTAKAIVARLSEMPDGTLAAVDDTTFTPDTPTGSPDSATLGATMDADGSLTLRGVPSIEVDALEAAIEAAEASVGPSGTYIRFQSVGGDYGCEVPVDADFEVATDIAGGEKCTVFFDADDDSSDLHDWDGDIHDRGGMRGAHVSAVELVEY